jgi:hypothetical protein
MKIKLKIICAVLLLLALISSCAENNADGDENNNTPGSADEPPEINFTSQEIADAIIAAYDGSELPEAGLRRRFSGETDEESDFYVDPDQIGLIVDGRPNPPPELDFLEDYAFYTPVGRHFFEVNVARLKQGGAGNAGAVAEMFERRLARVRGADAAFYTPEEMPILENTRIFTAGNYVIYLATTDNRKAEAVINLMIGALSSLASDDNNNNNIEIQPLADGGRPGAAAVSPDEIINVGSNIKLDFGIFTDLQPLPEDPARERTPVPTVTARVYSHNTIFLIGGKCEYGAKIKITGGDSEIFTGSDYGDYLVEVPFSPAGTSILRLSAVSEGKLPSEEIIFIVTPQTGINFFERQGEYATIVGYNAMTFFESCLPDYEATNLVSESDIAALQARTEAKIKSLRDRGSHAEIIYLVAPNPMKIWPELVPSRFNNNMGEVTFIDQWTRGLHAGGATVIYPLDLFMEHKHTGFRTYVRTDSHWSEYGALLGYTELMNHIARRFPDAAPRPFSDFEFYKRRAGGGDIAWLTGEELDIEEMGTFVRFNFEPPGGRFEPFYEGKVRVGNPHINGNLTTRTNLEGNFPSAYIMRDSFGGSIHQLLLDRFSVINFRGMADYDFAGNLNDIIRRNPDYIIYIVTERNVHKLFYR